jgi:hypothetical protein
LFITVKQKYRYKEIMNNFRINKKLGDGAFSTVYSVMRNSDDV